MRLVKVPEATKKSSGEDLFAIFCESTCFVRHPMLIPLVRFIKDYFGGYPLANHKSAAKRARQTIRKTIVNSARKVL